MIIIVAIICGTMKLSPGSRVLRYRPNRSTFLARACGMMRTERTTVSRTLRAIDQLIALGTRPEKVDGVALMMGPP